MLHGGIRLDAGVLRRTQPSSRAVAKTDAHAIVADLHEQLAGRSEFHQHMHERGMRTLSHAVRALIRQERGSPQ